MQYTRDPTDGRSGLLALLFLMGLTIVSNPTHAQEAALPPDDSEYIIFIIDTSGSMFNHVWPMMLKKVEETLNLYPKVKGFQVMNDEGVYKFTEYRGKWIPDTPAQRRAVVERLRTWNVDSKAPLRLRDLHARIRSCSVLIDASRHHSFALSSSKTSLPAIPVAHRHPTVC